MVDCLADLILRPGENGLPPVQAQLTLVAGVHTMIGGNEPGEVDGHPVPAVVVRELAHALGLLPRPDHPVEPAAESSAASTVEGPGAEASTAERPRPEEAAAERTTTGPTHAGLTDAGPTEAEPTNDEPTNDEPTNDEPTNSGPTNDEPARAAGSGQVVAEELSRSETAAVRLADLLGIRTTAGTALARLPQIAVVEEISGQLLALTSPAQIRRTATCGRPACRTAVTACTHPAGGKALGPPTESPGYVPSPPLQRFVRARDRRCRFPGCRARAIRCDLDHNTPWPAGPTSADNLCCLCRHHHRLSHQAPGWTMHRHPDGGLEWTGPSGDHVTTYPPRYGTDDDLPPPTAHAAPARQTPPGPPGAPADSAARPAPGTAATPPLTARECLLGRPLPPGTVDTDPPPF
jgi:hypothetical protein